MITTVELIYMHHLTQLPLCVCVCVCVVKALKIYTLRKCQRPYDELHCYAIHYPLEFTRPM